MAAALASHTTTPERCWWCVWEGYGQLHGGSAVASLTSTGTSGRISPVAPLEVLRGPRVVVPQREYFLLVGPLASVGELYDQLWQQSPNAWWPEDRAWFVATEIDLTGTFVAGHEALIDGVLAHPKLEASAATSADPLT